MKLYKRIALLLFICILLCTTACSSKIKYDVPELLEPAGMELDNVAAGKGEIFNVISCEGLVLPRVHSLAFNSGGVLEEINVCVGSEVSAGEVLARLDAGLYETALENARNGLEYNTQVWELTEKMAVTQIEIAKLELDQLKANTADSSEIRLKEISIEELENKLSADRATWELDRSASEKDIAFYEQQLANSILVAPCDGTVVSTAAAEGGYIMGGVELITLAEDEELYISVEHVTADQVEKAYSVRGTVEGNEVAVAYEAMDRAEYLSRSTSGKDVSSTFIITDAGNVSVESGMKAVIFVVTEYKADALIVPSCAVRQDSNGFFVYIVDSNGSQLRRSIERGVYNDAYVEVTEGLMEGDVVYAGN